MSGRHNLFSWYLFLLLPVIVLLVLAEGVIAPATAGPAADIMPQNGNEKQPLLSQAMDETHDTLEKGILGRIVVFDDFFGNEKIKDERKTEYQLRWRNSFRVDKNGNTKYGINARVNLVLSKISERLRLTISGEDELEQLSPTLPTDPGNPGFDRTLVSNTRFVSTELRYSLFKTAASDLFLGAGARVVLPPEFFVRSRYQYHRALDDVSLLRFGETLFLKNTAGLGETTELDLERFLAVHTLLRWANSGTVSEEINGLEWGTELSLIQQLTSRSAIVPGVGLYGNTSNPEAISNYRIFTTYRRNFLRNWLFFELEPEVSWPRNSAGACVSNFAFTIRLEILFQGAAAKKRLGVEKRPVESSNKKT